ncbi:MAG: hypothetical protein C0599_14490 [Salinivirgaceae bacterium]|nr:MAG: hypothetical protein C0599_14490 [Salinivirgaceae bacterium]
MIARLDQLIDSIADRYIVKQTLIISLIIFTVNMILKGWFAGLGAFYLDESHQVSMATYSIGGIWELHKEAANGPFFTWVLSLWMDIFGISEFATRMLSVVFASLAAIAIYIFAKTHYNFKAAVIAVILFTFGDTVLYFSHETRSYTLILLLVTLSFHYGLKLIENYRKRYLIIYFLLITALLYTHLTMVLAIAMQFYMALIYYPKNKKAFWSLFIAQFAAGLMILIWVLSNTWFGGNETTWGHIPTFTNLLEMIQRYLNMMRPKLLWALLFVIILIISLGAIRSKLIHKIDWRKLQIAVLWALFPIFAMYFISIYYNPRFMPRYMLFATPGIYLLIGYVASLPKLRSLFLIIIVIIASSFYINNLNLKSDKPEEWKKLVTEYKKLKDESSITYISASYMHWPFSYYYDREIFKNDLQIKDELEKEHIYFTDTKGGIKSQLFSEFKYSIVILAHNIAVDPNRTLLTYFTDRYKLVSRSSFKSIEIYKFENGEKLVKSDSVFFSFDDDRIFHNTIKENKEAYSGNKVSEIMPADQYSATYETTMSSFVQKNAVAVNISAMVKPIGEANNIKLVVDLFDGKTKKRKFNKLFMINDFYQGNEWSKVEFKVLLPKYNEDDLIKVFFWNSFEEHLLIDDMSITF